MTTLQTLRYSMTPHSTPIHAVVIHIKYVLVSMSAKSLQQLMQGGLQQSNKHWCSNRLKVSNKQFPPTVTRRPASADRTACRQFQATGQPVSRTQASDAMTSRLLRYEAKCVQRRCFQCGSVPLHSDIKGTELAPANILISLERKLIALQLCR